MAGRGEVVSDRPTARQIRLELSMGFDCLVTFIY